MFYDALGSLLGQAGAAMDSPSGDAMPADGRTQRESRQIALLLRRTRAIWPSLFASLARETEILRLGLEEANALLTARGLAACRADADADPLLTYRRISRALDHAVERLATLADQDWAAQALVELRRRLAEAEEIQGRLVDQMLSTR